MKYRLAIFDSDGTLADTLPWMRSVFNDLADRHGFRRIEEHEYASFRDLHGNDLLKAIGLQLWKVPVVMKEMRARMADRPEPFALFPGIRSALEQLHGAGVQLGIVSSNAEENVRRILGPATSRLIHHWNCGASLFGKAHKIKTVVRKSRMLPSESIYVGDEIRDSEAAREAGIAFGAVAWGQHSPERLKEETPEEFFETPAELVEKLCDPVG